jgi:23S rRNA (uracil1939-C5)-methyltransferase
MMETRPAVPDAFTIDVERLTYGPDALSHYERCVVFVPFAAPGDRAEVQIDERRRGYVRAHATRLLAPGPTRVPPFCPVFERCGGCQWQHVATDAQRAAKRAVVAEQLARLGGLRDVEVRPTLGGVADRAYRARITLAVRDRRLGYHRARSHDLVEVAACPIAADPVSAAIPMAAAWIAGDAPPLTTLTIAAGPRGVVLVGETTEPPSDAVRERAKAWRSGVPVVQGLVLRAGRMRLVLGDVAIHVPLGDGLHLEVPADAFSQVNPELNPLLVATVLEHAGVGPGAHAFDLYCGAGNFTLPLARRGARVFAIDAAKLAVDAARANAARTGVAGVRFECGDVAGALARAPRGPLDVAILDPPRQGASAALRPLVERRPARIVYVSCDPATLARDARTLVGAGYRLVLAQPLDLFPQTHHVETVAAFQLT